MMNKDLPEKTVFFFIGTEAEFIKVFPVIFECKQNKIKTVIIASGQNNIEKSRLFEILPDCKVDIALSDEKDIKKSAKGLLKWFIKTRKTAVSSICSQYNKDFLKNKLMIVHGDTVSTLMGASIGKSIGMKVCHIEAGLRSHNILNPFPEEIDRMLTSRLTSYHFAPGNEPSENLKNIKGEVINTVHNTLIDSLIASQKIDIVNEKIRSFLDENYFVFVMHRQENLMNKNFFSQCINEIEKLAEKNKCVMILHTPTKVALEELNRLEELEKNNNFILLPRTDYFDFMKVLENSMFVITDGGSNQEELSYMGKPTLIMRKTTERKEGLGENAILFNGDISRISKMGEKYETLKRSRVNPVKSPSKIIAEKLKDLS